MPPFDGLGRIPIADPIRRSIDEAFKSVPAGKRGALLIIGDGEGARMHVAARLGDHWKVAAGLGKPWDARPEGYVAVEASW